ncbi:pantoate--beta-alanine ligase [Myxococcota bacterium]|nr:pantoate--beta-alanine ligase [Myxococcota bacterium]
MNPLPPVITSKKEMATWSESKRSLGLTVGFVPTMGALHQGHLALVELAARKSDIVVVSIFVNPAQFGPSEDYESYPRTLTTDLEALASHSVAVVFAPNAAEMYEDRLTTIHVSGITEPLCGASRPGHFDGVTTVVAKLLNIVRPHLAVFGEKDYQQLATVRKMVKDLDMDCLIVGAPTVREPDGLAMSSRNTYLSPLERAQAPVIRRALLQAQELAGTNTPEQVERMTRETITRGGGRVDYCSCLNALTLSAVTDFSSPVVLATTVFFGKTRLIDNIVINEKT